MSHSSQEDIDCALRVPQLAEANRVVVAEAGEVVVRVVDRANDEVGLLVICSGSLQELGLQVPGEGPSGRVGEEG